MSKLLAKSSKGGGIYYSCAASSYIGPPNIEILDVKDNTADFGGAIYFNNCIFNPTFTNNSIKEWSYFRLISSGSHINCRINGE